MTIVSETRTIPLNRLVVSPQNVRKTDRKADIAALAASIHSHGLLQNLAVTEGDDGKFAVVAGGRRLAALKMLAKGGAVAKDYPVPCKVVAPEAGLEASLVENVHRVSMDAMDEVDAFGALADEQCSAEDIARRFGVTRRHVEQRLALACLSPKIKAAWKRGDVTLDAARAFCLVEDHARQEAVFRSLGKPVSHAASVRARLMEGRMRASDRLAMFVGLAAYEEQGGPVVRDLFDEEAVFIDDPALMLILAEQKLQERRDALTALGWGWTAISLGNGRIDGVSGVRLQPEWRDPSAEEQAELDRLRAALDALDEALDQDSTEDDARWETRDDLAAAIETLRQEMKVWDNEHMALSGVVLSLTHDGEVQETAGVVRSTDEKAVRALQRRATARRTGQADEALAEADSDTAGQSGLPKTIIRELSSARTLALRLAISQDPRIALAVGVAGMAARSFLRSELAGVAIASHPAPMADHDDLANRRGEQEARLPEDELGMLDWCLAQTTETLLSLMAVLVAGAVDLTHERGAPSDRVRQDVADMLALATGVDMARFWKADLDYWVRLPKGELLTALHDAPHLSEAPATERDAVLKAHAKLKKHELATRVADAYAEVSHLPDLFVPTVLSGGLALTDTGQAEAA